MTARDVYCVFETCCHLKAGPLSTARLR
jgi:hypothetical protein